MQLAASWRELRSSGLDACVRTSMLLVFLAGFLVFLIKYSIDYRDFATIKLIFLFPALPAITSLFLSAIHRLRGTRMEWPIYSVLSLLCVGFVLNVYVLLDTLIHPVARS